MRYAPPGVDLRVGLGDRGLLDRFVGRVEYGFRLHHGDGFTAYGVSGKASSQGLVASS